MALSPCNVLVLGETGTGKELVARYLHECSGRPGAFVAVNCSAIPFELLDAMLFGHTKGSFTGADRDVRGYAEEAKGGTLFLDEIGDVPVTLQPKLLRLIERKEIQRVGESRPRALDVRIVAATNRDIRPGNGTASFREDLYYRLAGYSIHVPPLRERPEDLDFMIHSFVQRISAEMGQAVCGLTPESHETLMRYEWPGNIRELENVLRQMVVVATGHVGPLDVDAIPIHLTTLAAEPGSCGRPSAKRVTDALVATTFRDHDGNVTRTAEALGIRRQSAQKRLRRLGLR